MARNHMGEQEYQTFEGWKRAIKKLHPTAKLRGDRDIGAMVVDGADVGEWDGAVGCVYAVHPIKRNPKRITKSEVNRAGTDFANRVAQYGAHDQGAIRAECHYYELRAKWIAQNAKAKAPASVGMIVQSLK